MNRMVLLVFLASPFALLADDPPKLNTLTEKEIADGWILLFDGKTTFGWMSPNDSKPAVADGTLIPKQDGKSLLLTTAGFSDARVAFEFRQDTNGILEVHSGCDGEGNGGNGLLQKHLPKVRNRWLRCDYDLRGGRVMGYGFEIVGGDNLGAVKFDREDVPAKKGWLGFSGKGFALRNIKLLPLGTSTLLSGKNLDGWKEHPGQKSKFSVTKEGWLHVQDGKGDLQTTKEWADFVLQLECKSNGKHLNSGIFFRCLPAQYQMGYEAQIHNGFGEEKEYTLDVFDPKTNKPLEKKKEKYSALDFGTGAIYRRQPARFQVSKDNEWFTMTVVAKGRHFATWVNGIQQVDWTDHRPLGDNARVGAYLKKGPISIQGHDPTTDLHFRNLRIAELPSK